MARSVPKSVDDRIFYFDQKASVVASTKEALEAAISARLAESEFAQVLAGDVEEANKTMLEVAEEDEIPRVDPASQS